MESPGINRELFRRLIREQYGSQSAFARACNVSRQYIWQIATGEISPSLARIVQFADMLNVTVDQLLEKENALEPTP